MMKRIYKYVSTYPTAETVKRKDRITEEELEFLVDEIEYLDFYIYHRTSYQYHPKT